MGTKSGMRYNTTKDLIQKLSDKNVEIQNKIKDAVSREEDLKRVYGGEAAKNYMQTLRTQGETIQTTLDKLVKNLDDEAEETRQKYIAQEEALKNQQGPAA